MHNLGAALIARGDRAEGEKYLQESLQMLPGYQDAENSLKALPLFHDPGLMLDLTERFIRSSTIK